MKTTTQGTKAISRELCPNYRNLPHSLGTSLARSDYVWKRRNCIEPLSVKKLSGDGRFTKMGVYRSPLYVWDYSAGAEDIAFMEEKDREYLRALLETDRPLFLKEMSPREALSREDQDKEFGLDLSLTHHQNLQHEFASAVARIRDAAKISVAATPTLLFSGNMDWGRISPIDIHLD